MERHELLTITYSSITQFLNCRKKYQFRYIRGLDSRIPEKSLVIGSIFHKALEMWFSRMKAKGACTPDDVVAVLRWVNLQFYMLQEGLKEKDILPEIVRDGLEDGQFQITNQEYKEWYYLVRVMFKSYTSRWGYEDLSVIDIERKFTVPVVNPKTGHASRTYQLRGKVDLLCSDPECPDMHLVVEHKTVSTISEDYVRRLPMDFQLILYVGALKDTGMPINGVVYDCVEKPASQTCRQKTGETEDEFNERKAENPRVRRKWPESDADFEARLTAFYEDPDKFLRKEVLVSDEDIARVRAELWQIAKEMRIASREQAYTLNLSHCMAYFKLCPFFDLCASNEDPHVLEDRYLRRAPHSELEDTDEIPDEVFG